MPLFHQQTHCSQLVVGTVGFTARQDWWWLFFSGNWINAFQGGENSPVGRRLPAHFSLDFSVLQPELVSSAIGSFKKDFIYIRVYVYASVWMYVTCVQMPTEIRKDHWVQWLGAAQHGWWELKSGPLEKQQMLLTLELSLQPQQDFTVSCQWSLKAVAIACRSNSSTWGSLTPSTRIST